VIDKVLIANVSALKLKYGRQGCVRLLEAIEKLIIADHARQLNTKLVDISNSTRMKTFSARAVTNHIVVMLP
jgi:hypothetical protein